MTDYLADEHTVNHITDQASSESKKTDIRGMVCWRWSSITPPSKTEEGLTLGLVVQTFDEVDVKNKEDVEEAVHDALRLNNDHKSLVNRLRRFANSHHVYELFLIKYRLLDCSHFFGEALSLALLDKTTEIMSWVVKECTAGVTMTPTKFVFIDMKVNSGTLVRCFNEVLNASATREVHHKPHTDWVEVRVVDVKKCELLLPPPI